MSTIVFTSLNKNKTEPGSIMQISTRHASLFGGSSIIALDIAI